MRVHTFLSALLVLLVATTLRASSSVAVIEDAPWSPGDAPRDGAAEFAVLLRLAELQRDRAAVGLVGIGDHRGLFQEGTQRGFEFAAQHGVPVVRLARGLRTRAAGDGDWFIDGGNLPAAAAVALLAQCLGRYGGLPALSSTATPAADELRAYREKLRLYQAEFTATQPAAVAMR